MDDFPGLHGGENNLPSTTLAPASPVHGGRVSAGFGFVDVQVDTI
jgi:hypothetical protein